MTKDEKIAKQKEQMTIFMNYFKNHKLDFKDKELLQEMQKCITIIFQCEIQELGYRYELDRDEKKNTFRLEFINDSNNLTRGWHETTNPPKIVYNMAHIFADLQSENVDERLVACKEVFKTVFHEIQHHRQYLMTKTNVSSYNSMIYARDFALMNYLEKIWYSTDKNKGNYYAYAIENDANEVGYKQYLEIMGLSDKKIIDLMNVKTGTKELAYYRVNVNSRDGQSHYEIDALEERDDATIPILDDLICIKGKTGILKEYPILQKEYNIDGSKKSAIELIKNMRKETEEIINNNSLSNEDKRSLIIDAKTMYYELIYRQLEKSTPEQLKEICQQIGKDESKNILEKMSRYFQTQKEKKMGISAKMIYSQQDIGTKGFILPYNNGTIKIEQNGKSIQVAFEDFIKTIDSKALQRTFTIPKGKEKGEMNATRFVEKYLFGNLPEDGIIKLKDGKEITAKQFVEYTLKTYELREDYPPVYFIKDTIQSASLWANHNRNCERLEKYYEGKIEILADVSKQIEEYDLAKADEEMQKRIASHQRKMQWVKGFIKDYEETEQTTAYVLRSNSEDENIKKVLNSIKTRTFLEEYDNNAHKQAKIDIEKIIPSMARLLKAAENITIDGGKNYLEEFVDIPNVNKILFQIKNSDRAKKMHEEADVNRIKGNLPRFNRTIAEVDKQYAQNYLRSGKISQGTIEEEIDYRKQLINKNIVFISEVKDKENIPMLQKQKASLVRVIARQEGKVPSEARYDELNGWHFITDTKKEKVITPKSITKDTKNISLQEINQVTKEIKNIQNQIINGEQQIVK